MAPANVITLFSVGLCLCTFLTHVNHGIAHSHSRYMWVVEWKCERVQCASLTVQLRPPMNIEYMHEWSYVIAHLKNEKKKKKLFSFCWTQHSRVRICVVSGRWVFAFQFEGHFRDTCTVAHAAIRRPHIVRPICRVKHTSLIALSVASRLHVRQKKIVQVISMLVLHSIYNSFDRFYFSPSFGYLFDLRTLWVLIQHYIFAPLTIYSLWVLRKYLGIVCSLPCNDCRSAIFFFGNLKRKHRSIAAMSRQLVSRYSVLTYRPSHCPRVYVCLQWHFRRYDN